MSQRNRRKIDEYDKKDLVAMISFYDLSMPSYGDLGDIKENEERCRSQHLRTIFIRIVMRKNHI